MKLSILSQVLGITSITTIGLFSFAGSASAVSLAGDITINGNSRLNRASSNYQLDFLDVDDIVTSGDFTNFVLPLDPGSQDNNSLLFDDPRDGVGGAIINIKDLVLSPIGGGIYQTSSILSFLDFGTRTLNGEVGNLTFDLDLTNFIVGSNFLGADVTGVWKFNGDTVADGGISGTFARNNGSYTISLKTAQAVPEPTSTLSLLAFSAFAASAVTKRKKQNKQAE